MTRTLAVLPLLIVSVFSALPACSGGAERCRTCGPTGSGGGTPGTGGMLAGMGGASGLGGTVGGAGGTVGGAGGTVGGAGGTVGGAGGTGAGGTVGGAGGTVGGAGGTVGGAGGTGAGGTVGGAGGTVGGAGGGTGGAMVDAGPPGPAVIVFYPFDDANTTRITDASGNGRHGTATATTYGTGMVRGDINMANTTNPGTQYVTMPAGMLQNVGDVSFAAWVRVRTNRNWSRVFDFGVDQNINMFLTVRAGATGNPVRFAITTGGGAATAEQRLEAPALALNTWTHLTVVVGATSAIYVNGVVAMTSTAITLRPSNLGNTVNNWIGRSTYAVDPWLDGEVDEFRIYGQALTAAEVTSIYLSR